MKEKTFLKLTTLTLIILFIATFIFTGCKEKEQFQQQSQEDEYVEESGEPFPVDMKEQAYLSALDIVMEDYPDSEIITGYSPDKVIEEAPGVFEVTIEDKEGNKWVCVMQYLENEDIFDAMEINYLVPETAKEFTEEEIKITDICWIAEMEVIEITLNKFPSQGDCKMYLDGEEIPMEGGTGNPVVRPNADGENSATGFFIGTEPWLTGLTDVDFPCCGKIQFDIPGIGLTNEYEFNLVDFDCKTASAKQCQPEWTRHSGGLVIGGTEIMLIENEKYLQEGNIYINDQAKLILRNAQLMLAKGDVATMHAGVYVGKNASLEIEDSLIFPKSGQVLPVVNEGIISITDSSVEIHAIDMCKDGSKLTMINSEMITDMGGLLEMGNGDATLIDSTIGALLLSVPEDARLNISDLKSGTYFESWDVHEMIPEADYNLVFTRSSILKDDLAGELKHGPNERGWLFSFDSDVC